MKVASHLLPRVVHLLIVLLLVSFGTFMLMQLTPGDPAISILGRGATPEAIARIHHQLGIDQPVLTQYWHWLTNALHFNLGQSLVPPGGSVADRITDALPISLELAVLALVMSLAIAIPVGVWSAYRQDKLFDRVSSAGSFGLLAIPAFVSGLVLALVFSLQLRWFPRSQWVRLTSSAGIWENLNHAFLPALTLAIPLGAMYARVLRTDMVNTLREPYVTVARAKGLSTPYILFRHALRPSSFSLVTLSGLSFAQLIGGTVIVEVIFSLPGVGNLLLSAVSSSDYPLVQGLVLVIAVLYVVLNALVELSYAFLDPRIRRARV